MTATDELCRLLDERGVEHQDYEFSPGVKTTSWDIDTSDPRYEVCAAFEEFDSGTTLLRFWNPTPEQAIEATLGVGTCKVEESWHGESEMVEYHCTACDEYMAVEVVKPNGAQPPNYCPNCGRKVVSA